MWIFREKSVILSNSCSSIHLKQLHVSSPSPSSSSSPQLTKSLSGKHCHPKQNIFSISLQILASTWYRVQYRVHSDRMRCEFFVANNRMRFTHASKKINETHVIQLDRSDRVHKNACDFTHAFHAILRMRNFRCDYSQRKNATHPI